jgi:signal transduction histidine kinase
MIESCMPDNLPLSTVSSTTPGSVIDGDASKSSATQLAPTKKRVNILMVDDQAGKLLGYEAILRELGENLIRATSGQEALRQLLKNDIAVVLIDVNMPELDGFQLADLIRQHPRFDQTALIFVSAVHLTDTDRLKGYERGGVDYVSVPVVPELLRAKVKVFVELHRKTHQLAEKNSQLRMLSSRLLVTQDVERRRIARNLHDSLGQYLASIKMNLDLLDAHVSPDAATYLSSALDSLEKCISETRTISQLLHPPLLDEAGFVSATRLFVDSFSKRSGIEATVDLPDGVRLSELTEVSLFRIVQESLTNIHRHSGSPSVEVHMRIVGNEAVLTIRDYGHGMPADFVERFQADGIQGGVGLGGMRERVNDLGGTLEIRSSANGTSIIVKVPVTSSTKDDSVRSTENVDKTTAAA